MAYLEQCDWCRKIIKTYSANELKNKGVARDETICEECLRKKANVEKFIQELPSKLAHKVGQLQGEATDMLKSAIRELVKD